MSEIEIVEERLRRFAVSPDDRDWSDVLRRAGAAPSGRTGSRSAPRSNVRLALAFAGIVIVAAVVALAALTHGGAQHSRPLTGATIRLSGYRFRTPAGFKASSTACGPVHRTGQPTLFNGFAVAASADGGCLEGFILLSSRGSAIPAGATPVDVGAYQGYLVSQDASGSTVLYVILPPLGGQFSWQAVALSSQGLTDDQLLAIAESGLPATPSATVG